MKSSLTFDRAAFAAFLLPVTVAAGVLVSGPGMQPAHAQQPSTFNATSLEDAQDSDAHDDGDQIPEDMLTWSIQPALIDDPEADAEERVSFRFELDPGESVEDEVIVTNFSEQELVFGLIASDGVVTEEGVFDLLPDPTESTDAGTWIEIDQEVTIPAGDSATVPFTVTVPEDALPGDHPAGIAASLSADAEGNAVAPA